MQYLRVPKEISIHEIRQKECSFSARMYRHVVIPTSSVKPVSDMLDSSKPFDKGTEPGSMWYLRNSTHFFIRTKALQDHSMLLYPKGDAIIPINPRVFEEYDLRNNDILMSKDSNVGECAMIDGNGWNNHMFSGGVVRLHPTIDRFYFFSFLKHPLFKTQLQAMTPSGATITHAKILWLDCLIPFPNQKDTNRVISYVSALMQAIVEKEKAIREKNRQIDASIVSELLNNQKTNTFRFTMPDSKEIRELGRLDASMYSRDFKQKKFLIINYDNGTATYEELGFEIGRGQNLQISCIGKSIYSDEAKPNFYRLVAPTDISEYRTVRQFRYLGNKKKLFLLKKRGCDIRRRRLL